MDAMETKLFRKLDDDEKNDDILMPNRICH